MNVVKTVVNDIPKGYKESVLGIIPDDWSVVRLKDKFDRITTKNKKGVTNVLTISAQQGLINQEEFFNKSVASKDLFNYILLEKGDFAYNKSYSNGYPYGAIKKLKNYDEGVVSSLYICFRPSKNNKSSDFYEQYFEAGMLNHEIHAIAQEGARNHGLLNISIADFFNSFIIDGDENELNKIADILFTWDKAIELKEKLIEQKKQQKKGLMQKLLTGEVRLPGFEEEWEEVKLGELGDFKTSSVDKKVNKNDIEILLVNYMDVYRNRVIDNTIDFMKVTATEKQIETFNVQYGDVLFTPSSETPDDIGHSAVVKVDSAKILYSYHLVRLRFKREMDVDFKAYVFNSSNLLREFSKRATGATRYTLSLSDFKESTIRIPKDITEQKAIGTVLLNSEREIRLLKKELEMLKQQKKGLMQLLLTGKVRVKV